MDSTGKRTKWSRERLIAEIAAFMERHAIVDRMPTDAELLTCDPFPRHDLHMAIHRYGGRRVIGQALAVSSPDSWVPNPLIRSTDSLIAAVRAFAQEQHIIRMPRVPELCNADRGDLLYAITKAGGFHTVATMTGLPMVHPRAKGEDVRAPRSKWHTTITESLLLEERKKNERNQR